MADLEIDERLPRNIEPSHYRIKLIPDFENFTTTGTVRIKLNVIETTYTIIFNINEIEIDGSSLRVTSISNNEQVPIASQEYLEGYRYKITLDKLLKAGDEYNLDIIYKGVLSKHLQGFYRITYENQEGVVKRGASTQFSPTDARRAFPCFDEPYFKAQFTISVARPADMMSLSNMPLDRTEILVGSENWVWDHYTTTPKMSTYIVGFIVACLKTKSPMKNLVRVWSRDSLVEDSEFATQLAPKLLSFLENYFAIKLPLSKIDFVAVPEFGFSAMENWGLITFRENALLSNKVHGTVGEKMNIALIMGHEIAHQWFGNLVTPMSWNDLWLKEGFATYFEYLSVEHVMPVWNIMNNFIGAETSRAFEVDALKSARPVSANLINSQQIRETFDNISYAKGACLVRMIHHLMGSTSFRNGLINLLDKYQYSNIYCDDLFACLSKETSKDETLKDLSMKDVLDSWVKQPGFPVLNATMDYDNSTLTLSQKRFFFNSSESDDSLWWIPVSVVTDEEDTFDCTRAKFWLKGERKANYSLNVKDWYLLNIYTTGYYIVNYDEKNWNAIINNITKFPEQIITQLINDSMNLARANLLDYKIPFNLLKALYVNNSIISYRYILNNKLKFLNNILLNTPACDYLKNFPFLIRTKCTEVSNRLCESNCACEVCVSYRKKLAVLVDDDNPRVRVQDAANVFSLLACEKTDVALEFLRNNWFKLQERYGNGFRILAKMVTCISPYMNTKEQLNKFMEFRRDIKDSMSTTVEAFDTAIETITSNIKWLEENYQGIERWLIENTKEVDMNLI
ncbi:aminopeptidase N isoform X2 [Aethina tumida]|nr:aminopeptidase N isoform X2 [Aethina tumida]XP_049817873.1 aminopeptidase N isoform X2 [Aethina tumida]